MITIVLNPKAGTMLAQDPHARLEELFAAAGAPARIVSAGSTKVADAARVAMAEGADAVVAGGGDGTVNRVASALVGSNTPLGVLPLGTLNHFARDLGIPFDIEKAVQTIVAAHATSIDVGEVNERTFVNNSSIGFYPDIVVEREKLRQQGYRKWTALLLATARILRHYRGLVVQLEAGGTSKRSRTPFLFVGNNAYQTDGLHLGVRARLDGGQLVAYLAPRIHARDLPKLLALALVGRARTHHTLEAFPGAGFHVDTPGRRRVRMALDGEVTVLSTPLQYRMRPRSLRVLVPAR